MIGGTLYPMLTFIDTVVAIVKLNNGIMCCFYPSLTDSLVNDSHIFAEAAMQEPMFSLLSTFSVSNLERMQNFLCFIFFSGTIVTGQHTFHFENISMK